MGQVALGFRSLFVRLAVFFVMAALLAWALGGTLFPRAETANLFAVSGADHECYWQVSVGGRVSGQVRWALCIRMPDGEVHVVDEANIEDIAGPAAVSDGFLYALQRSGQSWEIRRTTTDGAHELVESADSRAGAIERLLELAG